jgi:ATP-dependent exoDNAse (exonuclease V) beta subunit
MEKGTLTIYSASAGSGKTYKLTEIYLKGIFPPGHSYRKILAITFTNKATAEMKYRILDNLFRMSSGQESDYLKVLMESTGKPEDAVRARAGEILNTILHDYSRFSVTTIDSFFQKVIRAFAREAGLHSGYNVEIDHSLILSDAVDETISSAAEDVRLRQWLTSFLMSNLEEEKSWDLRNGIMKLAEELFNEKFRILSNFEKVRLEDKDFLLGYLKKIRELKSDFEKKYREFGLKSQKIFNDFGLTDNMFFQKSRGIPCFIKNMASGIIKDPGSYPRAVKEIPPKLTSGNICTELKSAINAGFDKILVEAIDFYDANVTNYESAKAVLSDIWALGILSDILRKVRSITTADNSFLLSDAAEFLSLITAKDQAPFIYEKTGNRYQNFMIDEFQDTSVMQWDNFRPLIENSMSEGSDNLIVGDIKQSIYRWRNSDWRILHRINTDLVDNKRFISEPLRTNWRSCTNIIRFNNALFSVMPSQLDEEFTDRPDGFSFRRLFEGAIQDDPGKKTGGYIRLEFVPDDSGEEKQVAKRWTDKVHEKLPKLIEFLQDKGYRASDIGILVRDGREGASVLKTVINYRNSCPPEKSERYNYNIISGDSLLLSSSEAVNFIISVISAVSEPQNVIHKAKMVRFWLLSQGSSDVTDISLYKEDLVNGKINIFPAGYEEFLENLRDIPLYEATESIISFFGLGNYQWNVAYLNAFQDCVLKFTTNLNHGFNSFLEWWESSGVKESVVLPESQDASRVLTIHKSKGLEFTVVIIPFLSWCIDHRNSHQPYLWLKPSVPPFSELGILPVRYRACLANTIFREDYLSEKFAAWVDNINLLYVAMTRAKEAIFGFIPDDNQREKTISGILKNAITDPGYELAANYNEESGILEHGTLTGRQSLHAENKSITSLFYSVTSGLKSLKLRLHGESYFSEESNRKINYGKLMHEIFENIRTADDIPSAVKRLVLDGKLPEGESENIEVKVRSLISDPPVSGWFAKDNVVMTEAEILLPGGYRKRPDRLIFSNGRVVIVDFKFGEPDPHYKSQMTGYRKLLNDMGYNDVDTFLWFVDKNEVETV